MLLSIVAPLYTMKDFTEYRGLESRATMLGADQITANHATFMQKATRWVGRPTHEVRISRLQTIKAARIKVGSKAKAHDSGQVLVHAGNKVRPFTHKGTDMVLPSTCTGGKKCDSFP